MFHWFGRSLNCAGTPWLVSVVGISCILLVSLRVGLLVLSLFRVLAVALALLAVRWRRILTRRSGCPIHCRRSPCALLVLRLQPLALVILPETPSYRPEGRVATI